MLVPGPFGKARKWEQTAEAPKRYQSADRCGSLHGAVDAQTVMAGSSGDLGHGTHPKGSNYSTCMVTK